LFDEFVESFSILSILLSFSCALFSFALFSFALFSYALFSYLILSTVSFSKQLYILPKQIGHFGSSHDISPQLKSFDFNKGVLTA
jgi:hypothetical protein